MKNKNKAIVIGSLIVVLLVIGAFYFSKDKNNFFGRERLFSFDQYTLLESNYGQSINQIDIDEDIINKIENGNYTLENPLIMVNPYGNAPLTALIGFKTNSSVTVNVTIKAKAGGKDLSYTSPSAKIHYLPIYGLYMDYVNEIIVSAGGASNSVSIPIEPASLITNITFPETKVATNNLNVSDDDFYFVSTSLGQNIIAYDSQGEVRWFLNNNIYKQIVKLDNNHLLLSGTEHNGYFGALGLLEIDYLGKVYNTYSLKHPYNNNMVLLPNGNIVYSSTDGSQEGKFDTIVEYNLKKGETVRTINIYDVLAEIDANHMKSLDAKWGDINSLTYDSKNDLIIVGIHRYSTIVALNNKSGKLEWILADPNYYNSKYSSYLLKPSGDFVYPVGNYNASMNGDILSVFVNDWDMVKGFSCSVSTNSHSYVADYKIDSNKKTITTNYTYNGDNKYFSFIFASYQNNGNEKNILFGREFFNFRENENCSLYDEGDFESKIITLNNNSVAFEMTIANSYNNLNKMSMYDGIYKFAKTNVKNHVIYEENDSYQSISYKTLFPNAILYTIPIEISSNTLTVLINSDDTPEYKVILVDEYGSGYVYTPNDDNTVIVKKGHGKVAILIEREGELYNTGYYVEI